MDNFTGFLEVSAAIIAAMGLAMSLEWLALRGFLRLMPAARKAEVALPKTDSGRL